MYKFLASLYFLFLCSSAFANNHSISFSHGLPAYYQKKNIEVYDVIYSKDFNFLSDYATGISARFGNLELDGESGTRVGIEGYISFEIPKFEFLNFIDYRLPIGLLFLDKNRYAEVGKVRNYGGRLQFICGLELGYVIANFFEIFYKFEHMSNAYRYQYNPGLDTHNVGFKIWF